MSRRAHAWIQVNASLARPGGSALPAARALFRALDAALPEWRRRRLVSHCFFQRKPPDLRLRFRGVEDLTLELGPLLAGLEARGHVRRRFLSVYEPETRQFGGPACMERVHAYWSLDTRNWIRLDRLAEAGEARIPSALLMAAVLNDLFWRALGDSGEVWDTWCNLLALLGSGEDSPGPAAPPPFAETLAGAAGAAEATLLRGYRQGNARLAAGLLDARARGRMSCGLRTILPHVAMFTLNRHGFDQTAATALARGMAAAWNPKARLRGGLPGRIDARRPACPACGTEPFRPRDAG